MAPTAPCQDVTQTSSQAINALASRTIVLIPPPEQVGPTPSPLLAGLGAFFLLSLDV